jgi:hypothetical protein
MDLNKTPMDIIKEQKLAEAKIRAEKKRQSTAARKKREGYNFWCYDPHSHNDYKVYFRNQKSAEVWIKKLRTLKNVTINPL